MGLDAIGLSAVTAGGFIYGLTGWSSCVLRVVQCPNRIQRSPGVANPGNETLESCGFVAPVPSRSGPLYPIWTPLGVLRRGRPGRAAEAVSSAAQDSTEGWGVPASHPSVSAQSRRTGSSHVQFFERRARSSRYPPTTATPARPRTSSALVPVRDSLLLAFAACVVGAALGALAPPVGWAMAPSDGRSISSGCMPGFDVAAALRLGAGLALDDGFPDCDAAAVAFGFTTDGA